MTKYKEKIPTFTCMQWDGNNFDKFKAVWPVASRDKSIMVIPLWDRSQKRWVDHYVYVGDWAVINDLSDELEILDSNKFAARFEEI